MGHEAVGGPGLPDRAVNALEHLDLSSWTWTCADALAYVIGDARLSRADADDIAARLVADVGSRWTGADLRSMVQAAQVDFGAEGRGSAHLRTVAEVADVLVDLGAERREAALDLLRKGGGTADLAIGLVPSVPKETTAPEAVAAGTIADGLVAMHLAGALQAIADATPTAIRRALVDAFVSLDEPELLGESVDVTVDDAWVLDDSQRSWLDAPVDAFEAVYRAALRRPSARTLLDLLVDHAGARLSGDDVSRLAPDALPGSNELSSAVNGLRAAVRSTGRPAPFHVWHGRPARYGMHPQISAGFAAARRRLLGVSASSARRVRMG
ncbi:MAG: DUF6416 domain-containing protein [Actinomycetota bacterium]